MPVERDRIARRMVRCGPEGGDGCNHLPEACVRREPPLAPRVRMRANDICAGKRRSSARSIDRPAPMTSPRRGDASLPAPREITSRSVAAPPSPGARCAGALWTSGLLPASSPRGGNGAVRRSTQPIAPRAAAPALRRLGARVRNAPCSGCMPGSTGEITDAGHVVGTRTAGARGPPRDRPAGVASSPCAARPLPWRAARVACIRRSGTPAMRERQHGRPSTPCLPGRET